MRYYKIMKIKGIEIVVRSKDCLYITIGKWIVYIDNSTGEEIIDTWKENEFKRSERNNRGPELAV